MDWISIFAGFGVGIVVGLTGVGGGALMTPILVMVFGIAHVTSVAYGSRSFVLAVDLGLFALWLGAVWLFGQDDKELAPVTRTYAITNVNMAKELSAA